MKSKRVSDQKARKKRRNVYTGFMDSKKAYDKINLEALLQLLIIYDVGG